MRQIAEHSAAMGMNRIGNRAQTRNDRVIIIAQQAGNPRRCGMYLLRAKHDQANLATRPLRIIGDHLIIRPEIAPHSGAVPGERDPVADFQLAEADRGE